MPLVLSIPASISSSSTMSLMNARSRLWNFGCWPIALVSRTVQKCGAASFNRIALLLVVSWGRLVVPASQACQGDREQLGPSELCSAPSAPAVDAALARCAMAPAGSKKDKGAAPAATTAAQQSQPVVPASSASASSQAMVSTPTGKTLVQKALEESGSKKRPTNHKRTADQIVNKVIYDNFRTWNALQTDGVRVGCLTLRERLLDDRRKVVIKGWTGGAFGVDCDLAI